MQGAPKSEYNKTQVLDMIVDYCTTPKPVWEIQQQFKHMRSDRSIFAYIQELFEEALLFKVPIKGEGKRWGYLNFQPSPQQLLTGEYLSTDEESPLKLFRTDPTITGEGLTTYPGLDVVFGYSPVVGELWKTVRACMLIIGYGNALEKAKLARKAQINQAFWELSTIVGTLHDVLTQIGKEQGIFDDPQILAEKFGFEAPPQEEIAAAWQLIVNKQLIKGDPQALYRAMPKPDKNEDEAS